MTSNVSESVSAMSAVREPPNRVPPVRLSITPSPAQVRIARLVAVAVSRKFGVSTGMLDDVRLAVGEASARAVAAMRAAGPRPGGTRGDLVELTFSLVQAAGARMAVAIRDHAPTASAELSHLGQWEVIAKAETDHPDSAPFLLAGLVDDVVIAQAPDGPGTVVSMSWPVEAIA